MARRLTARPLPAWVGDLPVFERRLDNGFKALVLPRAHAPVVVCDLYYPTGSVDEPAGRTGLAHFVEHMLFKGTDRFPKGQIDRIAFVGAGQSNAETGEDCTHYWFAFPAERWELALAVEADRMRGALFDPREVEAERHVIAEERARTLDSPVGRLDQTHLAVSFLVHPYRNPILGWPDDLNRITADDLRSFYRAQYRPDGAVLVVVGAVDPDVALDRIDAHFGKLPRGERPRERRVWCEPRQTGRRDFALVESEAVARGLFGWHTVPSGHPDGPALDVLSDLLTFGRRSRLWNRLVEEERLATWVEASQESARLAGQFFVQVEAAPGVDRARLEAEIRAELVRLASQGPRPKELLRSRHRLEAAWRWEQEDAGGLAAGLGHVALWDDWRAWQAEHRAALEVDADDIRRVASSHMIESGLTVGWSLPRPGKLTVVQLRLAADQPPRPPRPPLLTPRAPETPLRLHIPGKVARLADFRPTRTQLPNGLRLLMERRSDTGIVALELYVDAGQTRELKPGLAYLAGRLREQGTTNRTADGIATAIEDVGGTLDVGPTGISLRVRAEDLPLAVDLMSDLLLRPSFPPDALGWTRKRIIAELGGDRDDPLFRAESAFRKLVYGKHPFARDARGTVRQMSRLTREDVVAHHQRFFVPENSFLVAVGDFDPRKLQVLLRRHLKDWLPRGQGLPRISRPPRVERPRVRRVSRPGEQVHIYAGHLGVARNHPDYEALVVLDHILGSGPGFNDRLSRVLRDELGLAYAVNGGMTDSADVEPGIFRIYVGTGPEEAERAITAVVEQVCAIHRGEFSDQEVACARRYLAGSWVFDYQTVEQRAERLMELERFGLPLDAPVRWPARIARIPAKEVRRVARKHIRPAALARVEYGPIQARASRVESDGA